MSRVLLLGASGMLGSSLSLYLKSAGHIVIRQSRADGYDIKLNPLNHQAWGECLNQLQPDTVVNLTAATNVDQCEQNPQWAFDANIGPLLALKRASSSADRCPHIVHISTDQLYDGKGPHMEGNVHPCNVYALSKFAAELAIIGYPATVFRTNFFGLSRAQGRPSFSDWIIKSIKTKQQITLFNDVFFSAIHMDTLCEFINMAIVRKSLGTYNVSSSDGMSKAEFALQLAARLGLDTSSLRIGSVKELSLKARRPLDMRMVTTHFQREYAVSTPSISTEINKAADEYRY
jgi:dTDP-4-dehydrorhamnose reductase